mmetsp:Transcript_1076/g.2424  ORF Transcript_1076/g.2424 Transcript_1076/m.2424 type:complete len:318 (-) Transcript_1076:580-1533(-)
MLLSDMGGWLGIPSPCCSAPDLAVPDLAVFPWTSKFWPRPFGCLLWCSACCSSGLSGVDGSGLCQAWGSFEKLPAKTEFVGLAPWGGLAAVASSALMCLLTKAARMPNSATCCACCCHSRATAASSHSAMSCAWRLTLWRSDTSAPSVTGGPPGALPAGSAPPAVTTEAAVVPGPKPAYAAPGCCARDPLCPLTSTPLLVNGGTPGEPCGLPPPAVASTVVDAAAPCPTGGVAAFVAVGTWLACVLRPSSTPLRSTHGPTLPMPAGCSVAQHGVCARPAPSPPPCIPAAPPSAVVWTEGRGARGPLTPPAGVRGEAK